MDCEKKKLALTSATRQVRQQWFSACIFPLGHNLIGIEPPFVARQEIERKPPRCGASCISNI